MSSIGKVFTKGNIGAIAGGLLVDKIASSLSVTALEELKNRR